MAGDGSAFPPGGGNSLGGRHSPLGGRPLQSKRLLAEPAGLPDPLHMEPVLGH